VHELSLVETLIEQVAEEVNRAGQHARVIRLDLAVGRLSGVHVESLRFAFQVLAPGSLVDGAELSIREPPAQGHCRDCGASFEAIAYLAACVRCGSGNVRIEGGQDLLLESIELEEEDE
jgi:hydrogenase nickel incorporation protein HypA/HybF